MKAIINKPEYYELAGRYLAGEMSENEASEFVTNLESDKTSKQLFTEMQRDWNNIGQYHGKNEVNTDSAWNKLFNKLDSEQLVSSSEEVASVSIYSTWIKWAAVALILLTAGVLFFNDSIFNREKIIVVQNPTHSETLVQTLTDGSVVYIASNTELRFPNQFKGEKRNVTLKGEAFFEVSHNREKPFVIETPEMIVEVLGTSFNLKSSEKGDFELMVETGLVRVSQKSDPANRSMVSAGEKLAIVNNSLVKTSSIDNNYTGWRMNRMHFKDERLSNIIQIINRNYQSNIILEPQALGERRMTVTFHDNSLETITNLICKSMMLKSEIQGQVIILSEE